MLLTKDFIISVYNLLETKSYYRSDLVDLFGTPDGSKKGYIGSIDRAITWDWGIAGFKKTMNIIYVLSGQSNSSFDEFYLSKISHKENIVQTLKADHIINANPQMLYVFKFTSRRIPAFTADIEEIAFRKSENKWRIWLTYKPTKIFFIDPTTWRAFWDKLFSNGCEDPMKWYQNWENSWDIPCPTQPEVERMVGSGCSLDQYHIVPTKFLLAHLKEISDPSSNKRSILFTKQITKNDKRTKFRVATDNQVFWGLLSDVIGKTQVTGTVELAFKTQQYFITDIPANTIIENGWVFKQEIGTAKTICQAMLDVFGQDYIDIEFAKVNKKKILDSEFLRRATKISEIAVNYDKAYSETDFDYQLNLAPLATKYPNLDCRILFDLTAGLWNKSVAKDKDEFVAQWEHNLVKFPEMNNEIYVIWHYGLNSEVKDGSYKGKEIGEYLQSKTQMSTTKYQLNSITNLPAMPKLVLLPFFRDTPAKLERELDQISSDKVSERRNSMLYGAVNELIRRLLT